jgi:hypothetical protein
MTPVKQGRVDPRGRGDIQISARFVQKKTATLVRLYTFVYENPIFRNKKPYILAENGLQKLIFGES